ncbi:MAG: 30S ribosomal protein S18, partial [Candidatus Omnitrophota bacterium]|nr:30S ribosomal protein S18 [Candidatus Omnitrophota bacterium]
AGKKNQRGKFQKKKPKKGARDKFFFRKKTCRFCSGKADVIDYKDVIKLKRFVTEKGKILQNRITGNCAKHQRTLATAIKRARYVALLPYVGE